MLDDMPEYLEMAMKLPKSDDYSIMTIPSMKAIYATFPFRSYLSYMFGPMKVYFGVIKVLCVDILPLLNL